jgi:thioredoxin 1
MVHQVTDASFATDALQADLPVLVDFWAPWCGPCRAVGPVVEELAADFAGRLSVMKMNVDDNPLTAEKYGIRAIPTLIAFRRGEVVEQVTGAVSKASLVEVIEKALA